ncbi:MAG TPA: DUF5723 family protein [Chitinophagales bacterium]|nr:DUF5723 family protein [Chitinophagales bacterium]
MKLRSVILAAVILFATKTFAQKNNEIITNGMARIGLQTSFSRDYQSVGINPANLGLFNDTGKSSILTFGLGEASVAIHSEALPADHFIKTYFNSPSFTLEEKQEAAKIFANEWTTMNVEITPVAFAIQVPKVGGFAFAWKEHVRIAYKFNEFVSNAAFLGYNFDYFDEIVFIGGDAYGVVTPHDSAKLYSEIGEGTEANLNWYREFNLSFGRNIFRNDNIELYGGIGVKLLQGYGLLNAKIENGTLSGYSASSPIFNIDYGTVTALSAVDGTGLKSVGHGMGVDLGLTFMIMKRIKAAFAVTDLGQITWNGNVLHARDTPFDSLTFEGFDDYDIFTNVDKFMGLDGVLNWEGAVEQKVKLPAKFRFGGSVNIFDKFTVGIDVVAPLNSEPGNINGTFLGVGGDYTPIPLLRISSGLLFGGDNGFNMPLGLGISLGKTQTWQIGLATGDVLTYIVSKKPTVAASVGVLRFKL